MTIQQIFEKHSNFTALEEGNYGYMMDEADFTNAAKELIEYHVTQALKEALESIPCLGSSSDIATYEEVEDAVLNAYPLDLIK